MFKFILAFMLVSVSGCVSMGTEIKSDKLQRITIGKTTFLEAQDVLGFPTTAILTTSGTKQLSYVYVHYKPKQPKFVPVFGIFVSNGERNRSLLVLSFDKKDILQDLTLTFN